MTSKGKKLQRHKIMSCATAAPAVSQCRTRVTFDGLFFWVVVVGVDVEGVEVCVGVVVGVWVAVKIGVVV